jgi:hypothetical protein
MDGAVQAPFDSPVGPVIWYVEVFCLWVVLVVTHRCGSCLITGKENERGLGTPKVI